MKNNAHHINILVQLAKVDGKAFESELSVIRKIGSSKLVSDEDVEKAIETAEASDPVPDVSSFSEEEKLELIYDLVEVMKADGIIHKEEMKFCLAMTRKLGFEEDALFELVSNTVVDTTSPASKEDVISKARKYLK